MLQLKTSIAKQLGRGGEGGLAAADQDVLLQKVSQHFEILSEAQIATSEYSIKHVLLQKVLFLSL